VARKNGNGEGSRPRQRVDGRWEARYWVGGTRRSVYGSTRKEAADKLAKAIVNGEEPRTTSTVPNISVRKFFTQYDDAVRDTMKRRSLETYRDIARLHLLPAFGNKKLKDLTREHVQRMYSQKRDAGLSAARVRRIHGVLSSALNHALRWQLIDHNVCKEVSPPRVTGTGDTSIKRRGSKTFPRGGTRRQVPCPLRLGFDHRCKNR
jgi:integrase